MSKLRNPFRMRASEKIISDANFLGMYSPSILDMLSNAQKQSVLWDYVTYIHSSPGGGKTSLLRLFEPSVLTSLIASQNHNREVFINLKNLEVIDESNVKVLGVYLLCSRSFETLEDINNNPSAQKRLFFALMNARVILSTLRNILVLKNKKFPEDLASIDFTCEDSYKYFAHQAIPKNGQDLYEWAANTEEVIFSALDSLVPIQLSQLPGHDELFAFSIITPTNLSLEGLPICERILFMLDDAHILTRRQRQALKEELIAKRNNKTIWIAERIEALTPRELLDTENIRNRDFQIINLEEYFRNREPKISSLFSTIAEKRAALSTSNITSFQEYLSRAVSESNFREQYLTSIKASSQKLESIQKTTNKYNYWIAHAGISSYDIEEKAILHKMTEILIARDSNKAQLAMDFGTPLEDIEPFKNNEIRNAAIYFISQQYNIPYYYGFNNLVKMSSCNIEQFLSFSSELFENMVSNQILGNSITLSANDQERIIKKVAKDKWKALNHSTPYSKSVIAFLHKMAAFCEEETNQPNAPYAPGVNGFGIKDETISLFDTEHWVTQDKYDSLVNTISTCVAFNLLEVKQTNQGTKGKTWNVYYFNRWLCVYFNLPLTYGNWRPKTPGELIKWLK